MKIKRDILWIAALCFIAALGAACSNESTAPAPGPAPRDDCTDFNAFIHVAGQLPVADRAYRAAQRAGWLYLAAGTEGVYVADASGAGAIVASTIVATGGDARDVVIVDTLMIVANGGAGVALFSIADGRAPVPIDDIALAGAIEGVDARGDYAFVPDPSLGLRVIDLRTQSVVAAENTPGQPFDIELSATHAFVTDKTLGLRVVSIVNPLAPAFVTSLQIANGDVYGAALDGDALYIAAGGTGVVVVDVGDPDRPVIVGAISLPGGTRDVALSSKRLYAADRSIGVWVLDRSAPLGEPLTLLDTTGPAMRVSVAGNRIIAGEDTNGFTIIDATHPDPPPVQSEVMVAGRGEGVFGDGTALYVCANSAGMHVLDVSPGGQVSAVSNVSFDFAAVRHLAIAGGVAYAATSAGIDILLLADPFAPVRRVGPRAAINRSAVQDSLLLVAGGVGGLAVYAITSPGTLAFQGGTTTQGIAFDVAGMPGLAFVAASNAGLIVVDTSDPTQPAVTAALPIDGAALGIAAIADHVVIAAATTGIRVVDVTSPRFPAIVGMLSLPGNSAFVFIDGDVGYIASRSGGIHIVDLSDPTNPRMLGTLSTQDQAEGVTVQRGFMTAVDRAGSVVVSKAQCRETGPYRLHVIVRPPG